MPKTKKENPRLVSSDVYSYISNNSSLTEKQAMECFETYYNLLISIIQSDNRKDDLTVVLPRLGKFYFVRKKGKKNSTYVMPINFGKEYRRVVADRPSYVRIKFDISHKIEQMIKEKTKTYD